MLGATVGSYQIVSQIGEGGMGVVYLGRHTILGRPAAIKVLHPVMSQRREIVGRFFNEARAATASRHPGIVEIYDFGFLPDGAAFIAMEFLEGESLQSRLRKERRLPVVAAIQIGRQIAAALQAAHSKGITHRDLKPDNVFLVPDPEIGERVKLLDFGIAKLAVDDTGGSHTQTGMMMGTPAYMSPEQCRGASNLDGRSDLYSFGCMLYELLAGRRPFEAESPSDVIAHHLYFQPEPLRAHAPLAPEPLEQLIMALLNKDPAQRPASAGDVVAILDQWRMWNIPPPGTAQAASVVMIPAASPGRSAAAAPTTLSGAAASITGGLTGATNTAPQGSKRAIWFAATAVLAAVVGVAIIMTTRSGPGTQVAARSPASAESAQPAVATTATQPPPPPAAAPPTPAVAPPTAEPPPPPPPVAAPTAPASEPAQPAAAAPAAADEARPTTGAAPAPLPSKKSAGTKRAKQSAKHAGQVTAGSTDRADEVAPPAPASAAAAPAMPAAAPTPAAETAPAPAIAAASKLPPPAPVPAAPPAPVSAGSLDAVSSIASVSVDGPLPDSEIRSTVERALATFRDCYRSAARQASKTPALRITLSFVVDEGRAARGVRVGGDTLGLGACVKDAASKIRTRVAPDVGTATVTVVVKFAPTGN